MHHFKYVSYYLELSVPLYQFLVLLSELTLLIVIDITEKVFLYISRHFVTFPYLFFFYDFCWSDIYEGWYFTVQCLHLALFGNNSSLF